MSYLLMHSEETIPFSYFFVDKYRMYVCLFSWKGIPTVLTSTAAQILNILE